MDWQVWIETAFVDQDWNCKIAECRTNRTQWIVSPQKKYQLFTIHPEWQGKNCIGIEAVFQPSPNPLWYELLRQERFDDNCWEPKWDEHGRSHHLETTFLNPVFPNGFIPGGTARLSWDSGQGGPLHDWLLDPEQVPMGKGYMHRTRSVTSELLERAGLYKFSWTESLKAAFHLGAKAVFTSVRHDKGHINHLLNRGFCFVSEHPIPAKIRPEVSKRLTILRFDFTKANVQRLADDAHELYGSYEAVLKTLFRLTQRLDAAPRKNPLALAHTLGRTEFHVRREERQMQARGA